MPILGKHGIQYRINVARYLTFWPSLLRSARHHSFAHWRNPIEFRSYLFSCTDQGHSKET